jgi:hypothetical protein
MGVCKIVLPETQNMSTAYILAMQVKLTYLVVAYDLSICKYLFQVQQKKFCRILRKCG